MTEHGADHRPGVLVVDELHVALADVDTGDVVPVDPRIEVICARPELRLVDGAVPAPMAALGLVPAQSLPARASVVVDGPLTLRIDARRLLAWDRSLGSHVALGPAHLALLDRARTPVAIEDLDVDLAAAAADLARLGLLAVDVPASPEPEPEPAAPPSDPVPVAAPEGQEVGPPLADRRVVRPPSVFADLPDGALAKLHVVAFRSVGRVRRAITGRRLVATVDEAGPAPVRSEVDDPRGSVESEPARADRLEPSDPGLEAAGQEIPSSDGEASPADLGPSGGEAPFPEPAAGTGGGPSAARRDGRVPVIPLYCWGTVSDDQGYSNKVEPSLAVGMLFANARAHDGGRLEERYDFHKIRSNAEVVLAEWATDPVPTVFVFSDYLWNIEPHLDLSARVKALSPESICLHGGPSAPKYEDDSERFFADNPSVDVAVRGEGEVAFVEILERLDGDLGPGCLERLHDVVGLSYRRPTADGFELVRTEDRPRSEHLDVYPSPYLTGEFEDMLDAEWRSASVETNRGCPYGCTYCDWGSATLARIRKFDLERVKAELDWIMEHAAPEELHVADANFGIFARDVDIAEHVVGLRARFGAPYSLTISLAKNTVKYSQKIIAILVQGGVSPITASSAIQTTDPQTLLVIRRQNIKLEKYDELAVTFKEQGIPLVTDLLMGLPGATVLSFKNDLQHCFDREVTPRTMEIMMLPNSPMNEPAYREEHAIEVDEAGVVVAAATFTRDDYAEMRRLRLLYRFADHFGVLRHLLHFLQAERGLQALDVLHDIDRVVLARGNRYPLLAFAARTFDLYTVPPVAWEPFLDEVIEFLGEQYGLELDSELATVVEVQRFVLPYRGRTFPATLEMAHDFVAYRANLRAVSQGRAIRRSLRAFGPGTLTASDPGDISNRFVKRNDFPGRRSATTGNLFWVGYDWELGTPLARRLATNVLHLDEVPA